MLIISFFFRNEWHYGVVPKSPNLKKSIGYDGSFDYQAKDVFTLFLDSTNKKVTVNKKPTEEQIKNIYDKYSGDNHYSTQDVEEIVKSNYTKTKYNMTQNLFLPVRAIWTDENGWQYQTIYDESNVITKKEHNNGAGVECFWFDTVQDVCEFLNSEECEQITR
jgi:hypothetical protein